MRGDNTLWVPGTDHAGIATQIVVERQLQEPASAATTSGAGSSSTRSGTGRRRAARRSRTQMRRMGDSVAWKYEYFTMDERLSTVVTETFVSSTSKA